MIDKLCKRILGHPEILGRIIKGFIKEAEDVSLEEIIEIIKGKKDQEGNSYFQQLNNVIDIAHHGRVEFDYFCCINLPQADGTMKRIYLDVEIQNVENPGYAPLTRGNDYLSRMITSQNGKEYDYRNYDGMKKTYVIWILPQAAKKRDGYVNRINSKLENVSGSTIERLENYDKSEQIMIYLNKDGTIKIEFRMMKTAKLLLHCPDQPGILAEVTDFITVNKGNIIYLDQYVDHVENIFFMRIEWELKDFLVPQEKIEDYFRTLYGQKYEMDFRLYFSDVKPRMAIFVSKLSHCLFDMLARYTAGEWNVEIPLIISNHPDLQHVAERFGIPFYLFPITKETKEEQERKEMELLAKHKITFIVLARYMQVISEQMINAYPNKIINIHHSFLPAFVGAKPYHAAFQRGVKIIGATSHYVTTELDAGPIIEQDVVRITHKDSIEDLVNKGKDLEKIVLSRAVQKHIERKVLAYKNKTVIFS